MREDWIESPFGVYVNKISTTKQKLKQKEYQSSGLIPVIDQGQKLIGGYTDDSSRVLKCKLPAFVFGDHTKAIKLINFKFAPGADGTKVLEIKGGIEPKLIYYFTHCVLHKIDKGYARHYQHLEKEIIPLPPLPEQRAIVAKIEELFSSLDNGIANLKKAQEQLKVYRQAVLKKAFEGELTKEWREKQTDLPSAEELLEQIKTERENYYNQQIEDWKVKVKEWEENGKEGKKPGKPKFQKEISPFSQAELSTLSTLPTQWQWVTVDKLVEYRASSLKAGPFGSSLKKDFYVENGYKIYGQEQVIAGDSTIGNYYINQEKYNDLINCAVKKGDVLISLVGTVGKVLILPVDYEKGIINPRLVKLSLNDFYNSVFFKNYFESAYLKSLYKVKNHGTTMDVLNIGIIKELPYPLCSITEQHQIVQEIESRLSVCDKLEESIEVSLKKAEALKQSILKKAFDGSLLTEAELEACRQEADWESAEVLLAKIKDQKDAVIPAKKPVKKKSKTKSIPKPISETDLHAAIICKVIKAHESADQLHKLGHVKCEKIVHFAEYHLGLSVGRKPVKDAAGPDDYPHLKKVESRAKKAGFFFEKKLQLGSTYEAGKQIDKLIAKLEDKVDDKLLVQLDAIIHLFLPFDKVTAEIPATLYAGWNNLLLQGQSPTDDEIIYESRENWSASKLKIPRGRFVNGLAWLRKHKLVPTGTGLLVDKRKK